MFKDTIYRHFGKILPPKAPKSITPYRNATKISSICYNNLNLN